jgi:hypothetical protein
MVARGDWPPLRGARHSRGMGRAARKSPGVLQRRLLVAGQRDGSADECRPVSCGPVDSHPSGLHLLRGGEGPSSTVVAHCSALHCAADRRCRRPCGGHLAAGSGKGTHGDMDHGRDQLWPGDSVCIPLGECDPPRAYGCPGSDQSPARAKPDRRRPRTCRACVRLCARRVLWYSMSGRSAPVSSPSATTPDRRCVCLR